MCSKVILLCIYAFYLTDENACGRTRHHLETSKRVISRKWSCTPEVAHNGEAQFRPLWELFGVLTQGFWFESTSWLMHRTSQNPIATGYTQLVLLRSESFDQTKDSLAISCNRKDSLWPLEAALIYKNLFFFNISLGQHIIGLHFAKRRFKELKMGGETIVVCKDEQIMGELHLCRSVSDSTIFRQSAKCARQRAWKTILSKLSV